MAGLPPEAFDVLLRALSRICDDPHDRLHSKPLAADGLDRMAELEDYGFIEFTINEKAASNSACSISSSVALICSSSFRQDTTLTSRT
jgi:hypothetical protein